MKQKQSRFADRKRYIINGIEYVEITDEDIEYLCRPIDNSDTIRLMMVLMGIAIGIVIARLLNGW